MDDVSLLVVSCDKYADLWEPFFHIFFKQWPDCPYPIFLGTNNKTFNDERISLIKVGEDASWARGLKKMLDQIDSDHLILFLEDFLITQPVESDRVQQLINSAIEHQVGCLRLIAGLPLALPLSRPVNGLPGVGIIDKDELYRVSAQVAVWRVDTLKKLLIPGMSAWEFEDIGTVLSSQLTESFWGVYESAIVYSQCVEKGKWKPEGIDICRKNGIEPDLKTRAAFSREELKCYYSDTQKIVKFSKIKNSAVEFFMKGDRREGLRMASYCVKARPFSFHVWGILLFGLLGPRQLRWLKTVYYDFKIRDIRKKEMENFHVWN